MLHLEMGEVPSSREEVAKDVNKEVFGAGRRETRVHFHHKPDHCQLSILIIVLS